MFENGEIIAVGGYRGAVERLCGFEETEPPPHTRADAWERYTFRDPDGKAIARRGCELALGRLYDYEHKKESGKDD